MTCIVGLVEGDTVWIGGDSAAVGGYDLTVRTDEKVFRNGPMLFGFTSSFRMGQLLRYALIIPERHPKVDLNKYMVTTFNDAVRECLKTNGFATKDKEREEGGTFLVGFAGKLYTIYGDYQVGIALDGYDAIGCGDQVARGALYAGPFTTLSGRARVELALQAAERFSAGVRGPFDIDSVTAEATA